MTKRELDIVKEKVDRALKKLRSHWKEISAKYGESDPAINIADLKADVEAIYCPNCGQIAALVIRISEVSPGESWWMESYILDEIGPLDVRVIVITEW